MRLVARRGRVRCAMCHDEGHDLDACAGCGTLVHGDCRGPRCPTLGCEARVDASTAPRAKRRRRIPFVRWLVWSALTTSVIFALWPNHGHDARTDADVRTIVSAAQLFRLDRGRWPDRIEELSPRFLEPPALDPWGTPYRLVRHGDGVEVTSPGPDRAPGGGDDVSSRDARRPRR